MNASLKDFVVGVDRKGQLHVKRYTKVSNPDTKGYGNYSDYPLYDIPLDTIGM